MNGGNIVGNSAASSNCIGGGVFVSQGTFILNDGNISKNYAGYGGAVGMKDGSGTFEMKGGKLDSNKVMWGGGGFFIGSSETASLTGGVIENNKCERGGGGIFQESNSNLSISGDIKIINNISEFQGTQNNKDKEGGGINIESGTLSISVFFSVV